MVAVSYTAYEYQYGRGDVTELTVVCVVRKMLAIAHCLWYTAIPRNYARISSETGDFIQVDVKSRHIFA